MIELIIIIFHISQWLKPIARVNLEGALRWTCTAGVAPSGELPLIIARGIRLDYF